jgi:DNA-binding transcriptional LysR family regulator
MPIAFEVDHATQRVHVTATGDIRIEDVVALMNQLADLRALSYTQRFDARGALVAMTAEETRRLVPLIGRLREEHGQARTAFISDSDVSFGMARMYATLSADTDSGFMVYRTIEEGDLWLGWQRAQSEQRSR